MTILRPLRTCTGEPGRKKWRTKVGGSQAALLAEASLSPVRRLACLTSCTLEQLCRPSGYTKYADISRPGTRGRITVSSYSYHTDSDKHSHLYADTISSRTNSSRYISQNRVPVGVGHLFLQRRALPNNKFGCSSWMDSRSVFTMWQNDARSYVLEIAGRNIEVLWLIARSQYFNY